MLETAVRRRWNVDTQAAAATVNSHLSDADPRVSLRAAQIAALMEAQNQKDEHKLVDVRIEREHTRLDAIAAELGLDRATIENAQRQACIDDSGSQVQGVSTADRTR